jgi:uncharacterized membrane protein YphA (DoxX/SURF4 family)
MGTPLRLVPLRLVTGGTLAVHGFARLFGGSGSSDNLPQGVLKYLGEDYRELMEGGGIQRFSGELEEMGIANTRPVAHTLAGAEFAGGILFALGIFTPLAALALIADLGTSIKRDWDNGMVGEGGWELPAVLLAGVVTVLLNEW